jgi:hypothetical protein
MNTARFFLWATALSGLALLAGCIPSLNPVYNREDVVYEPAVVGEWAQADAKATWEFFRGDEGAYRLIYTDEKGQRGEFVAVMAEIEGTRFLDLYPEEAESDASAFYKFHVIPIHTIYRVKSTGPKLVLSVIDYKWLEKLLEENPGAVANASFNGRRMLTGPTAEVRAFVLDHKESFTGDVTLERVAKNVN